MHREDWLVLIVNAALKAGKEILEVYSSDFGVESKSDNSPLTEADKRAHLAIVKALTSTGLPILSEEGSIPSHQERKNWSQFWMVDPLDGTKEFVSRNGEFTVNIALIENGTPTMGVIYIPVTQELYFSDKWAYKIENFKEAILAGSSLLKNAVQLPLPQTRTNYIMLGSRSHMNPQTEHYFKQQQELHKNLEINNVGSSLKFCRIAEGAADSYPRFSPTMEWDTAAGHAIVLATGCTVLNWETQKPLEYNKENLLNPWFFTHQLRGLDPEKGKIK
jgi:3'(2'), 5'-bisphosphate nucleotidase